MADLRVLKEAEDEYTDALCWYEEKDRPTAQRFESVVESALQQILNHPKRWAVNTEGVRKKRLHGFPYCIIYREDREAVVVLAIAHTSRRPDYWRGRLSTNPEANEDDDVR